MVPMALRRSTPKRSAEYLRGRADGIAWAVAYLRRHAFNKEAPEVTLTRTVHIHLFEAGDRIQRDLLKGFANALETPPKGEGPDE